MAKNRLKIKGQVDYVDLRFITAQGNFLNKIIKDYSLKNLEAICFTNKRFTRFRLVVNLDGLPFLEIPPIDEKGKHSLYLKVSEYLAQRANLNNTKLELVNLAAVAQRRIDRTKKRKNNS